MVDLPLTELQWRHALEEGDSVITRCTGQHVTTAWARAYLQHIQAGGFATLGSDEVEADADMRCRIYPCDCPDLAKQLVQVRIELLLREQALHEDASREVLEDLATRTARLWNGDAAINSPTRGGEWGDVMHLVARAHFRVDPKALVVSRVCTDFRRWWKVAEGCNMVDVEVIQRERRTRAACLEKQLEREERDEAILVHRRSRKEKCGSDAEETGLVWTSVVSDPLLT